MANKRPYFQWFDGTLSQPIQQQGDDPLNAQFVPYGVANQRALTGKDNNLYTVADMTTNNRGAKNIIWSSEGFNDNGVTIPALTANQKKATGSHIANAGGALGTVAGSLDFSPYRALGVIAVLTSFTAGTTPSLQFEIDFIDDAGTPNVVPIWKPTAATTATSYITGIGQGLGTVPTVTGFTVLSLDFPVLPNGQFQWTVVGGPTAIVWSAVLYGIN
ncbi:MAG: hypothetical protein ACJ788_00100 [Ktedonobacteraceae bacterium]